MSSWFESTFGDVVSEHARWRPEGLALVCGSQRFTWRQLDQRVAGLAGAFHELGLEPGDRVLWLGQNCHRTFEVILAAAKVGAMVCPANWRCSADELTFVVEDLDPRIIFWQDEEVGQIVAEVRSLDRAEERVWVCHDNADTADGYEALLASSKPMVDDDGCSDSTAPVLLLYTAAFGGRPSAARLSSAGILTQALITAMTQGIGPTSVFLGSGPFFHLGTLGPALTTLVLGGANVVARRSDPEEFCRLIDREGCTDSFLFGKTVDEMAEVNADGRYDLSTLRSQPQSAAWNAMVNVVDCPSPFIGWGQTETGGMASLAWFGPDAQGGNGRPSPFHRMRIVDEDGRELQVGEIGEIVVAGPTVMIDYWNRPEINAARRFRGWHRSNDLGRREEDGSLSFIGPKVHLIKSGIENIYPAEVELCLRAHPAVADCAVIGVADPKWIQSVKAIVVLRDGAPASALELIEHCKQRIASYKKPRVVEFVESLPRAGAAIDYAALDAAHGGGGYPGGETRSI